MKIRCSKCGYEWNYRGNKLYATCPNCLRKVRVNLHVSGEVDADERC